MIRQYFFPGLVIVVVAAAVAVLVSLAMDSRAGPSGEPTITTTYYAEKSGRQCSQTLAQTSTGVAVAVSCSYPPAESRIKDLLEGAGQ